MSESIEIDGIRFKKVTDVEWAAFCAQYDCYGTEPTPDLMDHKLSPPNDQRIARVDYTDYPNHSYWILEEPPQS